MEQERTSEDRLAGAVVGGRYAVVRELGRGGMGRVYEAIDTRHGETVALKLMRGSRRTDPSALDRFRREAQMLMSIVHPNVVRIRDFGEEGGVLHVAMELVKGITVLQLLRKRGPLSAEEARPFVRGLTSGLAAVHAAGVVHRDIKPGNVLLEDGDPGRPKLVDFGIARADWLPKLTLTGTVIGTPRYMAPEQLAGVGATDRRIDVYAAGLLIHCVLAGADPFPPDGEELLLAVLTGRKKPLTTMRPDLPLAVAAVVHRAMAHVPPARYASAEELADAYEQALDAPDTIEPFEVAEEPAASFGLVLARVPPTASQDALRVARAHGAMAAQLQDGVLLCVTTSGEREAPAVAATRCAEALTRAVPDAPVVTVDDARTPSTAPERPATLLLARGAQLLAAEDERRRSTAAPAPSSAPPADPEPAPVLAAPPAKPSRRLALGLLIGIPAGALLTAAAILAWPDGPTAPDRESPAPITPPSPAPVTATDGAVAAEGSAAAAAGQPGDVFGTFTYSISLVRGWDRADVARAIDLQAFGYRLCAGTGSCDRAAAAAGALVFTQFPHGQPSHADRPAAGNDPDIWRCVVDVFRSTHLPPGDGPGGSSSFVVDVRVQRAAGAPTQGRAPISPAGRFTFSIPYSTGWDARTIETAIESHAEAFAACAGEATGPPPRRASGSLSYNLGYTSVPTPAARAAVPHAHSDPGIWACIVRVFGEVELPPAPGGGMFGITARVE